VSGGRHRVGAEARALIWEPVVVIAAHIAAGGIAVAAIVSITILEALTGFSVCDCVVGASASAAVLGVGAGGGTIADSAAGDADAVNTNVKAWAVSSASVRRRK
jgi:hypothetical protein